MTLDIYMEFQIHKIKLNIFKQKNRPKNQFYVFFNINNILKLFYNFYINHKLIHGTWLVFNKENY